VLRKELGEYLGGSEPKIRGHLGVSFGLVRGWLGAGWGLVKAVSIEESTSIAPVLRALTGLVPHRLSFHFPSPSPILLLPLLKIQCIKNSNPIFSFNWYLGHEATLLLPSLHLPSSLFQL
jgi:hypothetical protein